MMSAVQIKLKVSISTHGNISHILAFPTNEPGSEDILTAISTSYTQILLSKYYTSLRGMRTSWRNN